MVSKARDWRDATSGSVGIEFVLVAMLLIVLALGAADFGQYAFGKSRVTHAARAGAQYGSQNNATSQDIAGMILAARNNAADVEGALTVTARQYCSCVAEEELVCTATCPDGAYVPSYVEVTVQDELDLMFSYPGVTSPVGLDWSSIARVR